MDATLRLLLPIHVDLEVEEQPQKYVVRRENALNDHQDLVAFLRALFLWTLNIEHLVQL